MQSGFKSITLPDGKIVPVTEIPQDWWMQDGASGYVLLELIAPDPDQPRKDMVSAELEGLYQSIAEVGVRDALVVTPRSKAPWVRTAPGDKKAFFVVVSGHRRRLCALQASVLAVPVQVNIYESENKYREDAGILNAARSDLNAIELGYDFVRMRATGSSMERISSVWGLSRKRVYEGINLTKLEPSLQQLVLSKDGSFQLPIQLGAYLGGTAEPTVQELSELAEEFVGIVNPMIATGHASYEHLTNDERRFAMQKLFVAVIRKKKLLLPRAIELIRARSFKFVAGAASRRIDKYEEWSQPARRKDVFRNLLRDVSQSLVIDWEETEFRRIFANSTQEEVDEFIAAVTVPSDAFVRINKLLRDIRSSKKPTSAEVLQLVRPKTSPRST